MIKLQCPSKNGMFKLILINLELMNVIHHYLNAKIVCYPHGMSTRTTTDWKQTLKKGHWRSYGGKGHVPIPTPIN